MFIASVIDNSGAAVILANVTITDSTNTRSFMTDELGYFGFRVSAMEETVTVSVSTVTYTAFQQTYQVMPGEDNEIKIVLSRIIVRTFTPGNHTLIISTSSLNTTVDNASTMIGESFVSFPAGFFIDGMEYSFLAIPIDISSDENIRAHGLPMVVEINRNGRRSLGRRHEVSLGKWRRREERTEGRRKEGGRKEEGRLEGGRMMERQLEEEGAETIILIGVVFSQINILDGNDPYQVASHHVATISLTLGAEDYTATEASQLTCYFFDRPNGRLYLVSDAAVVREKPLESDTFIVEFQVSGLSFPLEYIIAFELRSVCYTAVRAFDEMGGVITTTVEALTRQGDGMVTIAYGETGTCIAVPCSGTLTLQIVDTLDYTPALIEMDLSEQRTNPVYQDKDICVIVALGATATPKRYARFILATTSNESVPTFAVFDDSELAMPPFCFLGVEVTLCAGKTVEVVTKADSGEVLLTQIQSPNRDLSNINDGNQETVIDIGSGVEPPTCHEIQTLCLQIPCLTQVNISAVQFSSSSTDGLNCTPVTTTNPTLGDLLVDKIPSGAEVVVELEGRRPQGVFVDDDISIARLKCSIGFLVGLQFQCHPPE